MSKFIVSVLVMLSASAAFAATTWDELVQKAAASSEELESPYGNYRILKYLAPNDASVAHRAEYFSAVGFVDADGKFYLDHIEVVSENWGIDAAGNWDIAQWGFSVTTDGKVVRYLHNRLVEDREGRVLEYSQVETTQADVDLYWQSILGQWLNGFESQALP